jgi:hypothetical protein
MKLKKESLQKNSEQFKNSELKLNLDNKRVNKSSLKEKKPRTLKTKKISTGVVGQTNETSEKTTELNPLFTQSLLKESKTRVGLKNNLTKFQLISCAISCGFD